MGAHPTETFIWTVVFRDAVDGFGTLSFRHEDDALAYANSIETGQRGDRELIMYEESVLEG